jgi:hypothetical protein
MPSCTALTTVNINSNQNFAAFIAASALAGAADSAAVNIKGAFGSKATAGVVQLVNDAGTGNGYCEKVVESVVLRTGRSQFLQKLAE